MVVKLNIYNSPDNIKLNILSIILTINKRSVGLKNTIQY